jgi:hypothetical protein
MTARGLRHVKTLAQAVRSSELLNCRRIGLADRVRTAPRPCPHPQKASKSWAALSIWRKKMDDLRKKSAADRSKINMHEPWELDYWTKELGVSKEQLQKAVDKVGNSAAAVRKELGLLGKSH